MKFCKIRATVLVLAFIALSTVTAPAHATNEMDDYSCLDWFYSLFEAPKTNSSVNASGINKPPPK